MEIRNLRKFWVTDMDIYSGHARESFNCAVARCLKVNSIPGPHGSIGPSAGPMCITVDGELANDFMCSAALGKWMSDYDDGIYVEPFCLVLDSRPERLLKYRDSYGEIFAVRGQAYMEGEEPKIGGVM